MRAGCGSSWAIWIRRLFWLLAHDISAAGNGTSVSGKKPSRVRALEALGRNSILLPTNLGPTSRVSIPIQRCDRPGARWTGKDQFTALVGGFKLSQIKFARNPLQNSAFRQTQWPKNAVSGF
jgi:hypothetical protein